MLGKNLGKAGRRRRYGLSGFPDSQRLFPVMLLKSPVLEGRGFCRKCLVKRGILGLFRYQLGENPRSSLFFSLLAGNSVRERLCQLFDRFPSACSLRTKHFKKIKRLSSVLGQESLAARGPSGGGISQQYTPPTGRYRRRCRVPPYPR